MRKSNIILSLLIILIFFGCNTEDDNVTPLDNVIPIENVLYVKSIKTANTDNSYLNQFYTYENNLLTNMTANSIYAATYSYNNDNNVITKQNSNENHTYEYDSQGRLIKELNIDTNNYYELIYSSNNVFINESHNGNLTTVSELTINSNGKITKVRLLNSTTSNLYTVLEYLYDNSGNIIKLTYTEPINGGSDTIISYQYDQNKNPFYYALKSFRNNTYYLECKDGIPNYINRGFTPNNINMINYETYSNSREYNYEYNSDGYPISRNITTQDTYFLYEY
ncbi:hypothetical protein [Lacinutrix sp.]|uniref:hypothetical protein n=1 Tax=Lacinutrix sp. TaxID=1937692 RepID=UPI0025BCB14D|nr:hypothetical protein [Lacinutrix sp.]